MSRIVIAVSLVATYLMICANASAQVTYNLPLYRDGTPTSTRNPRIMNQAAHAALYGMMGMSYSDDNKSLLENDTYSTQTASATVSGGTSSYAHADSTGTAMCMTATGATAYSAQVDTEITTQGQIDPGNPAMYPIARASCFADVQVHFVVQQNPNHASVSTAQLAGSMYFLGTSSNAAAIPDGTNIAYAQVGGSNGTVTVHSSGAWVLAYTATQATIANPTAAPITDVVGSLNGINTLVPCWSVVSPGDDIFLRGNAGLASGESMIAGNATSFSYDAKGSAEFHVEAEGAY